MPRSHNPHLEEYTNYKMAQEDPEMAMFNQMYDAGADDTAYQASRQGVPADEAMQASLMMDDIGKSGGPNEYDQLFAANMPQKPQLFPSSGVPRGGQPAFRSGEDQRHTTFLNSGASPDPTTPEQRDIMAAILSGSMDQPQSYAFGAEEGVPMLAAGPSAPLPPEPPPMPAAPTGFNFDMDNPAQDEDFAGMLAQMETDIAEPTYQPGMPEIAPKQDDAMVLPPMEFQLPQQRSKPEDKRGFWL